MRQSLQTHAEQPNTEQEYFYLMDGEAIKKVFGSNVSFVNIYRIKKIWNKLIQNVILSDSVKYGHFSKWNLLKGKPKGKSVC